MTLEKERNKKLLLYLSKQRDFVTATELSRVLNVSTKTIYRLIKDINNDADDGMLIQSERGRGYKLDYSKYIKGDYQKHNQGTNYSPIERRNKVMEEILLSSPVPKNVFDMYEDYYVSDTVIDSDEKIMAQNFERYGLSLKRKNNRLNVSGEEKNIRKAVKDLIQLTRSINLDELKLHKGDEFNRFDAEFVLSQLRIIEEKLESTIPYPYNVNIFSHLYILLSRFRKAGRSFAKQDKPLSPEEMKDMQNDLTLQSIAEHIITNTERYLHGELPNIEIYFLYQYLISSRIQKESEEIESFSEKEKAITELYIKEMVKRLKIQINQKELFYDLAKHIKPLLNRLSHDIRVKNNLLEQIKLEYTQTFLKAEEVSKVISHTFNLPDINEDENGYLTLYFAQAIERYPQKIKTLIMCTTGVGTSELLKVKVAKKFPEIEILGVVSSGNARNMLKEYPETELVISTVMAKETKDIPFLVVNAMFTADDQERLENKLGELHYGK